MGSAGRATKRKTISYDIQAMGPQCASIFSLSTALRPQSREGDGTSYVIFGDMCGITADPVIQNRARNDEKKLVCAIFCHAYLVISGSPAQK